MKSVGRLLVAVLLLGNLTLLASLAVHVVRWPGGFALVSKDHLTLIDTYADTRNWSPQDVAAHAPLATRIRQAGEVRTLEHVTTPSTASTAQPASAPLAPAGSSSSLFDMRKE